mmetsp:Transcript_13597/g.34313  ORF Transcript_13597/g.34313 Transcript_13597/m.34313 type:complete len:200 (+) Transcript_13597:325-924(+)
MRAQQQRWHGGKAPFHRGGSGKIRQGCAGECVARRVPLAGGRRGKESLAPRLPGLPCRRQPAEHNARDPSGVLAKRGVYCGSASHAVAAEHNRAGQAKGVRHSQGVSALRFPGERLRRLLLPPRRLPVPSRIVQYHHAVVEDVLTILGLMLLVSSQAVPKYDGEAASRLCFRAGNLHRGQLASPAANRDHCHWPQARRP